MRSLDLSRAKWTFRDCDSDNWLPARVPGCVHLDLRRARQIPDPFWGTNELDLQWIEHRAWEYRATFRVSATMLREAVVEMVADGLDTLATVKLNGRRIAQTENMFTPHRWSVKGRLREGENELLIRFAPVGPYLEATHNARTFREFNDPRGNSNRIRKEPCQFGWDWGPRLVTAGVWQGIRLEAWSENRLENVEVRQRHPRSGKVYLDLKPELTRVDDAIACHWQLELDGETVTAGEGGTVRVDQPELWWPAGQGEQPLYTLRVEVRDSAGRSVGTWKRRIGLRRIELDQGRDSWGRRFAFRVNGRLVFAKGANWIPAHSFVAGLTRKDYERDLRSAVDAHMNMVRVWGGGIYENEAFYDICDELGLMVWQDFCFACTQYPGGEEFLELVRPEAEAQVRRLRHRASLVLWCGNNETWWLNRSELGENPDPRQREEYERLFHELLPEVVAANDPATAYWPSSPYRPGGKTDHAAGEHGGDTHFWDVWHSRSPVQVYEKWAFRFVSEFGMQSYSSPETNRTFCPPDDTNVFGAAMENHQKNAAGNQIILDYVSRRYRFPRSQDHLIYLSQLNQAYCLQFGVEHLRRLMPRCWGALYWQLNDCWPVASWSSIEFTGRWRALHYAAKRFFAPHLVSAKVVGEETAGIGNYRRSTVEAVELWAISDAPDPLTATLRWEVMHVGGKRLLRGAREVDLESGTSQKVTTVPLVDLLTKHRPAELYVRIRLVAGRRTLSEDTVFLTAPRFIELPPGTAAVSIAMRGPRQAEITVTSKVFLHRLAFSLPQADDRLSDNFFDVYPKVTKRITLHCAKPTTAANLSRRLRWQSLVDTY